MIQRKQSIFLLLAALLAFSTWFFPVASYQRVADAFELRTTGFYTAAGIEVVDVGLKIPFAILLTVIGAGLLACIFLYNQRKRQMRFVRGAFLLVMAIVALLFITDNSIQAYLSGADEVESSYGLSFIIPLVMMVLIVMAERSIKADEDLIRSADRLR